MTLADDILKGARALAAHTGFTEREIRQWAKTRELPLFNVGKHLCGRKSELDRRCRGGATALNTGETTDAAVRGASNEHDPATSDSKDLQTASQNFELNKPT